MAIHAILRKTYGHYRNNISCLMGQSYYSKKMDQLDENFASLTQRFRVASHFSIFLVDSSHFFAATLMFNLE